MSDLTTIATIRRAIAAALNQIGPKASAQYALEKLDAALADEAMPERQKAAQVFGNGHPDAMELGPKDAGGAASSMMMGTYRLGELVNVLREPEVHPCVIVIEFREPVTGDDLRAIHALLKAQPAVNIALTSTPDLLTIREGAPTVEPARDAP